MSSECKHCQDLDEELKQLRSSEDEPEGTQFASAVEYRHETGHWPTCPSKQLPQPPEQLPVKPNLGKTVAEKLRLIDEKYEPVDILLALDEAYELGRKDAEQPSPAEWRKAHMRRLHGFEADWYDAKEVDKALEAFASQQIQQAQQRIADIRCHFCEVHQPEDDDPAQTECSRCLAVHEREQKEAAERERDEVRKYVVCSYCGDKQPKIEPFDRETYVDQILAHLPDCPTHPANKWFAAEARLQQLEEALRECVNELNCFDQTTSLDDNETTALIRRARALLTPPAAGEEG